MKFHDLAVNSTTRVVKISGTFDKFTRAVVHTFTFNHDQHTRFRIFMIGKGKCLQLTSVLQ